MKVTFLHPPRDPTAKGGRPTGFGWQAFSEMTRGDAHKGLSSSTAIAVPRELCEANSSPFGLPTAFPAGEGYFTHQLRCFFSPVNLFGTPPLWRGFRDTKNGYLRFGDIRFLLFSLCIIYAAGVSSGSAGAVSPRLRPRI